MPVWMETTFPVIQIILLSLIAISSILIIFAVLKKPSDPEKGTNAITGISDTYYMHNKSNTKEGRLQKLIIIALTCVFVFTILYFILQVIMNSYSI